jgi:hypothetical protein
MLRFAVVVLGLGVCESVTEITKFVVPTKVPVKDPVMLPVEVFSVNPAGSAPLVTAHR